MEANKINIKTIETIVNGEVIINSINNVIDNEINIIRMEQEDSNTNLSSDIINCFQELVSKLDSEGQKLLFNFESLMIQENSISEKKYFEKGLKSGLTNLSFLKDLGAQYIL